MGIQAGAEPLTREELQKNNFQSIRAADGKLVLKLRDEGARFAVQRGNDEPRASEYGEAIAIAPDEKLKLAQRHGSLAFSPLPAPFTGRGLWLRKSSDARSVGGELTYADAAVLIPAQGDPVFVPLPAGSDPSKPLDEATQRRILEGSGKIAPLAEHSLRAEKTDGTRTEPPFSSGVEKLRFAWRLAPEAGTDPVEIRWIATDTGGVAPKNHIISSSKSEAGKTAGEFTLTKPINGFPPGKYRVELQQAGKIIYKEDFSIQ
jgi:hypothetical protein